MKTFSPSLNEPQADSTSPVASTRSTALVPETTAKKEAAYAEKNSNYFNITDDVLSKFIYYQDYSTLSIRPFSIAEVRKIFKASVVDKLEPIVEAISACIDPDKSALDLTIPDFWALMFWERMNSYKKSNQWNVEFNCSSDDHIRMVAEGKATQESFKQVQHITAKSQLNIKFIDHLAVIDFISRVHKEYEIFLDAPRMRDSIEAESILNDIPELEDQVDMVFIIRLASHLNKVHGETLEDRIEFINKIEPDLINEILEFEKLNKYGISEKIETTCEVCGTKGVVELSLDAQTFFPQDK